jgi:hypothetical protein
VLRLFIRQWTLVAGNSRIRKFTIKMIKNANLCKICNRRWHYCADENVCRQFSARLETSAGVGISIELLSRLLWLIVLAMIVSLFLIRTR